MHVRFASRQLERRYRESREGERAWGTLVERKYVMRIRQIQAAAGYSRSYGVLHPCGYTTSRETVRVNWPPYCMDAGD
ncbi:MAG: hypothetical protein U5Q44_04385 [Dehalococcoidia bacterium]|nr:hypothetical protein [Dehalococcoidia bacterium]